MTTVDCAKHEWKLKINSFEEEDLDGVFYCTNCWEHGSSRDYVQQWAFPPDNPMDLGVAKILEDAYAKRKKDEKGDTPGEPIPAEVVESRAAEDMQFRDLFAIEAKKLTQRSSHAHIKHCVRDLASLPIVLEKFMGIADPRSVMNDDVYWLITHYAIRHVHDPRQLNIFILNNLVAFLSGKKKPRLTAFHRKALECKPSYWEEL